MQISVCSLDNAPQEARDTLAGAKRAFGFVPNMLGTMAHAPALLKGYLTLSRLFDESSLSPTERQVVLLAVSHENGCSYCMAAHTATASMQGVSPDVVQSVRDGRPIAEPRLEALRSFTKAMVARRGHPSQAEFDRFVAAGYAEQQVLEVILGVGMKTLSNYTNHIADTVLDEAFAEVAWAGQA